MAGKSRTTEVTKSDMTVLGATIGSLFSILWVAATGFFFLKMLDRFGADGALLSQLIWPGVVLALGVPLIVFVWFGGSSVVMGLTKLRSHLDKLDEYVSGFDEMEARSSEIRQNMDSASSTVSSAANAFSENIDRFEQDVRPLLEANLAKPAAPGAAPSPVAQQQDAELTEIKRRFGEIMKAADAWFYPALAKKNEKPGRGNRRIVVAPGGSDKYFIAEELAKGGFLAPSVAATVVEIYNLDISTRQTGRRSLTKSVLARLENQIKKLEEASVPSLEAVPVIADTSAAVIEP